jgi:hypothetical protein
LRATSDLLPNEPHIYSSTQGDLVAEFKGIHGTLTSIVSPRFLILFASVNGVPVQETLRFGETTTAAIRRAVHNLTEKLRTGKHGPVDSSR